MGQGLSLLSCAPVCQRDAMNLRGNFRRLYMGLATLSGARRMGFFTPYRRAADVSPPALYPAAEALFAAAEPAFRSMIAAMGSYAEDLAAVAGADGAAAAPPAPRFNQSWFPRLDAAALYTIIRTHRPARVIEVGSGHSTRFAARAVADGGLEARTRITAIDPAPRAALRGLPVTWLRRTAQEAGAEAFADLAAGDVLFIDSSHILMPGTDVDFLLNAVIPALPGGVLIHIHDIFLPEAYPAAWEWRGYNEQQAAAAMITGGGFEILWAGRYAARRMTGALKDAAAVKNLPLNDGAFESSLWLRKI